MKILRSQIIINNYLFDFVNQVDINSSWDMLTDTATIIIPKKITFEGKPIVSGSNSLFKRGDKVEINLGYGNNLNKVFTGYISAIKPKLPIEISCDDEMYILKQETISRKTYSSITLKNLLGDIVGPLLPYETNFDLTLQNFRISNVTIAQVLDELRKLYGVVSFVREGKLYVGFAYLEKLRKEKKFDFQENIASHELEYRRIDDIKIKVKAVSIFTDEKKKKIEIDLGDPDGEQRTLNYYNKSESELKKIAEEELKKLKYEGYFGYFEAFGEPFVRHSDLVNIVDKKVPEREGKYLVKSVNYLFGIDGYRQKIQLDRKISSQL